MENNPQSLVADKTIDVTKQTRRQVFQSEGFGVLCRIQPFFSILILKFHYEPTMKRIMKTRSLLPVITLLILATGNALSQTAGNPVTDLLLSAWSPRNYTVVPVTDQQIEMILQCGIKAPSSRNGQPWHFTVLKNEAVMKEIIPNITPGNVIIVLSGKVSQAGTTPDFDCGLATQNMFVAASSMGLGARIYGGPIAAARDRREALQIPKGFTPVIMLRVGNIEKSTDAVSGASPRKAEEEIVNWVR
jgi:nitroreductase